MEVMPCPGCAKLKNLVLKLFNEIDAVHTAVFDICWIWLKKRTQHKYILIILSFSMNIGNTTISFQTFYKINKGLFQLQSVETVRLCVFQSQVNSVAQLNWDNCNLNYFNWHVKLFVTFVPVSFHGSCGGPSIHNTNNNNSKIVK